MKKIGIFYGSTTGYTADVAVKIAESLGVALADVYNVADTAPSKIGDYDILLFGSSTWGAGDMQSDVEDFIDGVQGMYLGGKEIALFGCGDETMSMTFGSALGEMYRRLKGTGATFIAPFNTDGYHFDDSGAYVDGVCVGLVIDNVNHPELTDSKISDWTKLIK